ncbi:hypothetical protein AM1_4573 [Acaryochloris marina MBIC11017]|uniref:Uncharacterized protein n=1 Tax=Acaryochloris marina (strain MBIC 11017) TaxID=329726 RepID=B0BZA3_ACAM1|nr:hypothetical protein AM1_4573 [Acaryochloris marina MBIC11017]
MGEYYPYNATWVENEVLALSEKYFSLSNIQFVRSFISVDYLPD